MSKCCSSLEEVEKLAVYYKKYLIGQNITINLNVPITYVIVHALNATSYTIIVYAAKDSNYYKRPAEEVAEEHNLLSVTEILSLL